MTKRLSKFVSFIFVLLIFISCFCLSACNDSDTKNPLSVGDVTLSTAVDGSLEDMLKDVTLTFTDPDLDDDGDGVKNEEGEDDSFTAKGFDAIRAKSVIVNWTGSSQTVKNSFSKYKVTFQYLGYSLVVEYTIS